MAKLNYKSITLEKLFDCKRGNSKYTKTYCNQHSGDYEVFTGTTIGHFGFIDSYDYDCENLTYSTDGEYAGTLKVLHGKHNVGGHRAILIPKVENLVLEYFKYILQPIFFLHKKKGDVPSLSWRNIKGLLIEVPIDDNGNYDIKLQNLIISKYKSIEIKKKELEDRQNYINRIDVKIPHSDKYNYINEPIHKLFYVTRGNSLYTKNYCKQNAGEYPIYSAANDEPLGYMNTYDYDGRYVSISINGIAGVTKIIEGCFSINADRVILTPKTFDIDLDYVVYILEPILRNLSKGRKGINNKNEFSKLTPRMIDNVKISIPIDSNGDYCLDEMRDVSKKHLNILEIKKQLNDKVSELLSTEISF